MSSDLITPTHTDDEDEIEALINEAMVSTPTGEDTCQVCGIALTYAGRGRHPKFCDEHKPTGSKRTTANATQVSPRTSAKIHDEFLSQWNMLAVTVGIAINPIDGQILMGGGQRMADSVVHLTEVNPRFKKAVTKAMEATVWGELIAAMSPMAIMIAANHGMIKIPPMMIRTMAEGLGLKLEDEPVKSDLRSV